MTLAGAIFSRDVLSCAMSVMGCRSRLRDRGTGTRATRFAATMTVGIVALKTAIEHVEVNCWDTKDRGSGQHATLSADRVLR